MEFKDYREEMKYLRDFLNEQGYLYYVLDAPVIPDYEYDQLNRRLEELEAEHPEEVTTDSPTQRIGGKTLDGFQSYTHDVPLESLQDVFVAEELAEFCGRMDEALGAQVEELPEGLRICGVSRLRGGEVDAFCDHRIAMAAAIAANASDGAVTVHGAEAVAKSYPDFWSDYQALKEETPCHPAMESC